MSSVRLSEKHGVNPSVGVCFFCRKDKDVILFGKMSRQRRKKMFPNEKFYSDDEDQDVEAPRRVCISREPCEECKNYMKQGVILISVDPKRSASKEEPHLSGGWVVVKEEAIEKVFPPKTVEELLQKRVGFIEDEAWDQLGLPREELKQ